MTEITLYQCDICGKTFEDEAECKKHETEEKYAGKVCAWGWTMSGEKIQFPWTEDEFVEMDLLRFDSYEDYRTAHEYLWDLGYEAPPLSKEDFENGKPMIIWCPDHDDRWLNVRDEIAGYQRVMNIAMREA